MVNNLLEKCSLKILDLFCGAGGFSHGFHTFSNDNHLAIDIDPFALETYRYNYPHASTLNADINALHSIEIEKKFGASPDIIIASPPCEEFSKANPESSKTAATRIYGEGTAKLVLDAIRIIGDLSPKVFVIENVAALLQGGGKRIIQREFKRVGIENIEYNLIRAHQHGNPSKRLRVFISNIKLKLERNHPPNVIETIDDLPSLTTDAILTPGIDIPNHVFIPLSIDKMKNVQRTRWGQGAKQYRISRKRSIPNWVRLFPDRVATSINGLSRYIHPFENRLLTVREHARLMSYPDSFIFIGPTDSQYNQVGESVPPLISHQIAQVVCNHVR